MEHLSKIAVIGAGAWGSAVAMCLAGCGHQVYLVGRDKERMQAMQKARCNAAYLPGIFFPDTLQVGTDLAQALDGVSDVIIMVPSVAFTSVLEQIKPYINASVCVVWGTKGLASGPSPCFLDDQVRDVLGDAVPRVALSGPSFAIELAQGKPTAVVLASESTQALLACQHRLHGGALRCYVNEDIKGVQLCGVMKNILAVAAGISDGLALGANARSALLARGMQEVMGFVQALGLSVEAVMGLSGMGDTLLSATSDLSRNRQLGLGIGQGRSLEAMTASLKTLEALNTISLVKEWADALGLEAAIIRAVWSVLVAGVSPTDALTSLMARHPCQDLKEGLSL